MLRANGSSAVYAQNQPPIAGGAGVFVMPAQIGPGQWGCYLLDVDAGTLCAYQYMPGSRRFNSAPHAIIDTIESCAITTVRSRRPRK